MTARDPGRIYEGFPSHKRLKGILSRFEGDLSVLVGGIAGKIHLRDAHFILNNAAARTKKLYIAHANQTFGENPENERVQQVYADRHVLAFGANGK